jgi:hypothetical protein
MVQRTLPVCILVTSLALFPLAGACSAGSSASSANEEGDAAGSSSSRSAVGSTSSGGGVEDSPGGEVDVPEGGADDSRAVDVSAPEGAPEDSRADISVLDVTVSEDAEGEAGVEASGSTDAPTTMMEGGEAGAEAGGPEASVEAAAGCVNLTVLNYEVWCSVTVNGGAAFVTASQTVCVPPGTEQLATTALPDFELGPTPWHDTAGDTGQGDPGTVTGSGPSAVDSTTVVVGNTAKCVWVCCPFDDGVGCPTTDQCP